MKKKMEEPKNKKKTLWPILFFSNISSNKKIVKKKENRIEIGQLAVELY